MRLDRVQRQHQVRRDLLIGAKLGQQVQHIGLSRGQRDDDESVVRAGWQPKLRFQEESTGCMPELSSSSLRLLTFEDCSSVHDRWRNPELPVTHGRPSLG
jgi:phosphate-selective porin